MNKILTPNSELFANLAKSVDAEEVPDDKKQALLVPVLVILRDSRYSRSANLVVSALSYAKVVVNKAANENKTDLVINSEVLVELLMRLGAICDQPSLSPGDTEEIRLSSFSLITVLLSSLPNSTLTSLYTARCLPSLGHLVSLLISSADSSPASPNLKLTSLRCLNSIASPLTALCEINSSLQPQLAIVTLTFMPGILAALANILKLSNDPRTGHSLIVESLSVLQSVVTAVLRDSTVDENESVKAKDRFNAGCPPDGLRRLSSAGILPPLPLTSEHLKDIGKRVSPVLATIFSPSLFSHSETVDPRVRDAAYQCCVEILSKSAKYLLLKEANGALLTCVVASLANKDKIPDEIQKAVIDVPSLCDLAEDLFLENLRKLPKFLVTSSINFDSNLSARLASTIGYVRLLGVIGRLSPLMSSHDCLLDLFRCTVRTAQLKPITQALLGLAPAPPSSLELATAPLCDNSQLWEVQFPRQPLPFKFLDDPNNQKLFQKFLQTIMEQVEDPSSLISFFYETMVLQLSNVDKTNEPDDVRLEAATFALSVMISKLCDSKLPSASTLELPALACVERFCSEAIAFTKNRASLMLLSSCAKATAIASVEAISTLIRRSLLIVLEACASGKSFIENSAVHALADIAAASGAETLSHFIEINADYLANAFVLRLRHLAISRHTLYAVAAAFRFSSPKCLPYFADPLRQIVSHLPTSDYDPELAELLLLATSHSMLAILRWDLPVSAKEPPALEQLPDDTEEPVSSSNKEWPTQILLARDAADACAALFSSFHVNVKLAALDVARLAVLIVRPATNELLPLVHRLWPGLSARFIPIETRKQTILKALDLLLVLAETSGDFIRHRFVTGMLSPVCSTMRHLVETMTKPGVRLNVYRQTFDYKLLVRLVYDLPRITNYVKITIQSDLEGITEIILSALAVAIRVAPEADSLKKSAFEGLKLLTTDLASDESRQNVRQFVSNRAKNEASLFDVIVPLVVAAKA